MKRRRTRTYPGPLSDAEATEFAVTVGLDESVEVWPATECIQWDGRLAGHARDDCKLAVTPTTTHLVLTLPDDQPSPVSLAGLQVGSARFGTQIFVLLCDGDEKAVTLSTSNGRGKKLVELLVSLGATKMPAPQARSIARMGSAAWNR